MIEKSPVSCFPSAVTVVKHVPVQDQQMTRQVGREEWTYVRLELERYARWASNSISCVGLPSPCLRPISANQLHDRVVMKKAIAAERGTEEVPTYTVLVAKQ